MCKHTTTVQPGSQLFNDLPSVVFFSYMQLIFILKSTEEGRSEEDSIKAIQSLKEERRGRSGVGS